MRFLFGLVIGIAVTIGAAYVHDINLPAPAPAPLTADPGTPAPAAAPAPQRIVNWDVLGGLVDGSAAFVRAQWNKIVN